MQLRSLAVMKIAWSLLFLRGLRDSNTVKLTGQYHSMFLVSPNHLGERLRKMEDHGLIQIEELRKGVSPVITLLLDKYYE